MASALRPPPPQRSRKMIEESDDDEDMIDAPSRSQEGDRQLHLSLDWGTTYLSAAVSVTDIEGIVNNDRLIHNIRFDDRGHELPMIMALIDGKFVYGFELQDMIDERSVDDEKVIDMLKLELYEEHSMDVETPRQFFLKQQLADLNTTVVELIGKHLEAVIESCMQSILKSSYRLFDDLDLRKLPRRIRISVPQMWPMKARLMMQDAAKAAGLDFVTLAYEPQCALAYLLHTFSETMTSSALSLKKGQQVLVCDLGGGTGDFVTYSLLDDLTIDSRLEAIGLSSGALCGSVNIDEFLLSVLEESDKVMRLGGVAAVKMKMGLSDLQWRKRCLRMIERDIKCRFTGAANILLSGTILGQQQAELDILSFTLASADVKLCFDKVIKDIKPMIDKQLEMHQSDAIFVTGGLSKSKYVMGELRRIYENGQTKVFRPEDIWNGECFPVSRGGLLRYDRFVPPELPADCHYALLQDEPFTGAVHQDAVERVEEVERRLLVKDRMGLTKINRNGKARRKWTVVTQYFGNTDRIFSGRRDQNSKWVLDRLYVFFPKGTKMTKGQIVTHEIFQDFLINEKKPQLSATFVYCTEDYKTHDYAKKDGKDGEEYRDGIGLLKKVTKEVDVEMLKQNKVTSIKNKRDETEWPVKCQMMVRYEGGHQMTVGWKLLCEREASEPPSSEPPRRMGRAAKVPRGRKEAATLELWEDPIEPIWEATHSPFVEGEHLALPEPDAMEE